MVGESQAGGGPFGERDTQTGIEEITVAAHIADGVTCLGPYRCLGMACIPPQDIAMRSGSFPLLGHHLSNYLIA